METETPKPKRKKSGGRKKGSQNKVTRAVKETIIAAFEKAGGEEYLLKVAEKDPKTFCQLLGKVLPSELHAELTHSGDVTVVFNR